MATAEEVTNLTDHLNRVGRRIEDAPRHKIGVHEAGHVFMMLECGFSIEYAYVTSKEGMVMPNLHLPQNDDTVAVLCAGLAATNVVYDESHKMPGYYNEASRDMSQAMMVIHIAHSHSAHYISAYSSYAASIPTHKEKMDCINKQFAKAAALLYPYRDDIRELGAVLEMREKISGDELLNWFSDHFNNPYTNPRISAYSRWYGFLSNRSRHPMMDSGAYQEHRWEANLVQSAALNH